MIEEEKNLKETVLQADTMGENSQFRRLTNKSGVVNVILITDFEIMEVLLILQSLAA